jgi:hypothetical protein
MNHKIMLGEADYISRKPAGPGGNPSASCKSATVDLIHQHLVKSSATALLQGYAHLHMCREEDWARFIERELRLSR